MSGKQAVVALLLILAVIAVIASRVADQGNKCEAAGGTWEKNPGSAKTGWHCVMPK